MLRTESVIISTRDYDMDRRCPACDAVMLPRTLATGSVIDACPACGLSAVES